MVFPDSDAVRLEPVTFGALPGWDDDDHAAALGSFRLSCREILGTGGGFSRSVQFGGSRSSWLALCNEAFTAPDARHFFETGFQPYHVRDTQRPEGLFTGYFEPEVDGSRAENSTFHVPVYRRPLDLVAFPDTVRARIGLAMGRLLDGEPKPYLSRREIEAGGLAGQGLEIVYLKDWADAFFIHVQGSGRVQLEGGCTIRLTYAAKSGLPYTGIGGLLVERGEFRREDMSMQSIRGWMDRNPGQARALMWENQSFIFFREIQLERPELGALGAQHVQLTPRRSLAVDRSIWGFGTPVWLDTEVPLRDEGGMSRFRQLMIAQDTGSAIRGAARGDVYWGFGSDAARVAGPMKSAGSMFVLLPLTVARELGLPR